MDKGEGNTEQIDRTRDKDACVRPQTSQRDNIKSAAVRSRSVGVKLPQASAADL